MKNTLAYYSAEIIKAVKSCMTYAVGFNVIENFSVTDVAAK